MRIRTDRDKPNKQQVALETWRSIHSPIPSESITGNNLSAMRTYHNQTKLRLLKRVFSSGKYSTLLDIGSGRGGDLSKWLKVGFYRVFAVEPDHSNLAIMAQRKQTMGLPPPKIVAVAGPETEVELGGLKLAEQTQRRYYILPKAYANLPVPSSIVLKYLKTDKIPQQYQTKSGDVVLDTFIKAVFMDKRYEKPYYRGDDLVYLIDPSKEFDLSEFNGNIMTTVIKDPLRHIVLINSKIEDVESLPFYAFNPSQNLQEGQVDIVTAFFSFTFMFESRRILRRALTNIHKLLRPGGRFIGIVLSGERVFDAFSKFGKGKLGNKALGWSIKAKYDQDIPLEENPWNRVVKINLRDQTSMVKKLEEPLASINVLTKEAERVGLEKSEHIYAYHDYFTGETAPEVVASVRHESLVTQTTLSRNLAREALGIHATESEVSSLSTAIDPQFYLLQRSGLPGNELSSLYRTFSYIKRPIRGPSDLRASADAKAEQLYTILASPKETYTTDEVQELSDELRSLQAELSKYYILNSDPTLQRISDEISKVSVQMEHIRRSISWGLPGITTSSGLIRRQLGIEHLSQDRQQAIDTLSNLVENASNRVQSVFTEVLGEFGEKRAKTVVEEALLQLETVQKTIKQYMRVRNIIEDEIRKRSRELTSLAVQLRSLVINEESTQQRINQYIDAIYPSLVYASADPKGTIPRIEFLQSDVIDRIKQLSATLPDAFTSDNINKRIGLLENAIETEENPNIKSVAQQYVNFLTGLQQEDSKLTKIRDTMIRKRDRLRERWKKLGLGLKEIDKVLIDDLFRFRDTTHFIVTASGLLHLYNRYDTLDTRMRDLKLERYTYIRERVLDAGTSERLLEMKNRARELEESKTSHTMVKYLQSQIETLESAMTGTHKLSTQTQEAEILYKEYAESLKYTTDENDRQNLKERMDNLQKQYTTEYDSAATRYNRLYTRYQVATANLQTISSAEFTDTQATELYEIRAQILRTERQLEVYATGLGVAVSKVDWTRASYAVRSRIVMQIINFLPENSPAITPLTELHLLIETYRRMAAESVKVRQNITPPEKVILEEYYMDSLESLTFQIRKKTKNIENIVTQVLIRDELSRYKELVQKEHPDYTPVQINSEAKRMIVKTVTFSVETVRDPTTGDLIVENAGTHKFRVRLPLEQTSTSYHSDVLQKSECIVAGVHSIPSREKITKRVNLPPEKPPSAPDASTTKKIRETKLGQAMNIVKADLVNSKADDVKSAGTSIETEQSDRLQLLETNEENLHSEQNPASYTQSDVAKKISDLKEDEESLTLQIRTLVPRFKRGERGNVSKQLRLLLTDRKSVRSEISRWEQYIPLPTPPLGEEVLETSEVTSINEKIRRLRIKESSLVDEQKRLAQIIKSIAKLKGTKKAKESVEYSMFVTARDQTRNIKQKLAEYTHPKELTEKEEDLSQSEGGEEVVETRDILCLYNESNEIIDVDIERVYTPGDGNCMAYAVLISKDPQMINYSDIGETQEEKTANPLYAQMRDLRKTMLKLMIGDWAEDSIYNKKYIDVYASIAGKRLKHSGKKESDDEFYTRGYHTIVKIVRQSGCWLNTDMLEVVADVLKTNIIVVGKIPEETATDVSVECLYPLRYTSITSYADVVIIYNNVSMQEKAFRGVRGGHFEAVRISPLDGGLVTRDMASQNPDINKIYKLLQLTLGSA